jgi:hypothetical protein
VIFIVGSGRTGTHWLASSFADSRYPVVMEDDPLFQGSVQAALRPAQRDKELAAAVPRYRSMPEHTVDKCHPNLWRVEELLLWVPGARFILMRRSVHDTVRSMLNHPGTLRWVREAHLYGRDCSDGFLGRHPAVEHLGLSSLASGCAARAALHQLRVDELADQLRPPQAAVFDYGAAVRDPQGEAERLVSEFGLPYPLRLRAPRAPRHPELTPAQRRDVDRVCEALGVQVALQGGEEADPTREGP